METIPLSFFESHRDGFIATALCRGPWDPGTSHGGPVAALIGAVVERFDPDPELQTVRYTIELIKPVPLGLLEVETTMLRPGARVRLIGVSLRAAGVEVARAVALRIRRVPVDVPIGEYSAPGLVVVEPEAVPDAPPLTERGVGILSGLDIRSVSGSPHEPGPARFLFRVHKPLIDDEPISPTTRALIPADFGNGMSSGLSIEEHFFINPDLTVNVHRMPEGAWVGNHAHTWMHPGGASVAEATLFDERGEFGRATQNLYVAQR